MIAVAHMTIFCLVSYKLEYNLCRYSSPIISDWAFAVFTSVDVLKITRGWKQYTRTVRLVTKTSVTVYSLAVTNTLSDDVTRILNTTLAENGRVLNFLSDLVYHDIRRLIWRTSWIIVWNGMNGFIYLLY